MELIDFTLTDHVPVAAIYDACDNLEALIDTLGLLDYEDQPESEEWKLACKIGEIQMLIEASYMVEAAQLLPKAVRLANEMIIQARRRA